MECQIRFLALYILLFGLAASLLWLKQKQSVMQLEKISTSGKLHALPIPTDTSNNGGQITPCPQNLTSYVLIHDNKATICRQGFTFTSRAGKVGNGLITISNLLYVAEKTSSRVILEEETDTLSHLVRANTSLLHNFGSSHNECNRITVRDDFFISPSNSFMGVFLPTNTLSDQSKRLKLYLKPHIKLENKIVGSDTLVMHIRSGDIMVGSGTHAAYVQPPLAFYQKIITENSFTKAVIVCEDHNNPTIDALARWNSNITFSSGVLEDDIATIIGASYLAVSFGTFSTMLSLLSDTIKKIYVPCVPGCFAGHYSCEDVPIDAECYSFPNFTKSGQWKNTKAQRELMLSYPIESIVSNKNTL